MVACVDGHKDEFGVEPICTTLQVAPSTYYAAKARLPSARALRDAVLLPLIMTLWAANYRVYGVHKMWKALARAEEMVGRDQVARLMRQLGIQGVRKGKRVRTTRPDGQADRHPDLVDRTFAAERPRPPRRRRPHGTGGHLRTTRWDTERSPPSFDIRAGQKGVGLI